MVDFITSMNKLINIWRSLMMYHILFVGVGDMAGWTLPLSKLAEMGILEVTTCNVNVKTASSFFSTMCAPGSLNSYHNPFGEC